MNVAAVIFTHPPDYEMARIAVAHARRIGLLVTVVIGANDADPGLDCPVMRSRVDRAGNLNGTAWLAEELVIMESLARGLDWLVKIDSDTILMSLDWIDNSPGVNLCGFTARGQTPSYFFGACYAIRPKVIPYLARHIQRHGLPRQEDQAFGILAEEFGGVKRAVVTYGSGPWLPYWPQAGDADREAQWIAEHFSAVTVHCNNRPPQYRELAIRVMRTLSDAAERRARATSTP